MEVIIPAENTELHGELIIPSDAVSLVLFVHGSGSSRLSPRNQFVARHLEKKKLGTLLFDLLTMQEETIDEETRELRFDIPFLAKRLLDATRWAMKKSSLPVCYFGASTGAAAALVAAASLGGAIKAIVSRGGRPDLALDSLPKVVSPTLLIVGGSDHGVIELNEKAYALLNSEKKLEIVPGATHLFEEKGKLEIVAKLAADWFLSPHRKK